MVNLCNFILIGEHDVLFEKCSYNKKQSKDYCGS